MPARWSATSARTSSGSASSRSTRPPAASAKSNSVANCGQGRVPTSRRTAGRPSARTVPARRTSSAHNPTGSDASSKASTTTAGTSPAPGSRLVSPAASSGSSGAVVGSSWRAIEVNTSVVVRLRAWTAASRSLTEGQPCGSRANRARTCGATGTSSGCAAHASAPSSADLPTPGLPTTTRRPPASTSSSHGASARSWERRPVNCVPALSAKCRASPGSRKTRSAGSTSATLAAAGS